MSITDYLKARTPYLRTRLFDDIGTVTDIVSIFRPDVTRPDIDNWRQWYLQTAPHGDRKGTPVYDGEREWLRNLRAGEFGDETASQMKRRAIYVTKREDLYLSRIEAMIAYRPNDDAPRRAFTADEDLTLLLGGEVRSTTGDYQRVCRITKELAERPVAETSGDGGAPGPQWWETAGDNAEQPVLAPSEPTLAPDPAPEPAPAPEPTAGPAPLATFNVGHGMSLAVESDRRAARFTVNDTTYLLTTADIRRLAEATAVTATLMTGENQ